MCILTERAKQCYGTQIQRELLAEKLNMKKKVFKKIVEQSEEHECSFYLQVTVLPKWIQLHKQKGKDQSYLIKSDRWNLKSKYDDPDKAQD